MKYVLALITIFLLLIAATPMINRAIDSLLWFSLKGLLLCIFAVIISHFWKRWMQNEA